MIMVRPRILSWFAVVVRPFLGISVSLPQAQSTIFPPADVVPFPAGEAVEDSGGTPSRKCIRFDENVSFLETADRSDTRKSSSDDSGFFPRPSQASSDSSSDSDLEATDLLDDSSSDSDLEAALDAARENLARNMVMGAAAGSSEGASGACPRASVICKDVDVPAPHDSTHDEPTEDIVAGSVIKFQEEDVVLAAKSRKHPRRRSRETENRLLASAAAAERSSAGARIRDETPAGTPPGLYVEHDHVGPKSFSSQEQELRGAGPPGAPMLSRRAGRGPASGRAAAAAPSRSPGGPRPNRRGGPASSKSKSSVVAWTSDDSQKDFPRRFQKRNKKNFPRTEPVRGNCFFGGGIVGGALAGLIVASRVDAALGGVRQSLVQKTLIDQC